MSRTISRKPRAWLATSVQFAVLSIVALLLAFSLRAPALAQEAPATIEEGTLTVAFAESKPIVYLDGEKLTGVDGDVITKVAEALGLTIKPVSVSFEESLAAVADGTADVAIGDIFGTEKRAELYAFSDPLYYNATLLAVRDGVTVASVDDLADKVIATGAGFAVVPDLQAVPGVKEVKEYENPADIVADLGAGTVDIVVIDPPSLSFMVAENPDLKLQLVSVEFDPAAFPVLASIQPAVILVNKDHADLAAAISAEIAKMQEDGSLQAILEQHGLTDPSYTTAPSS